MVLIEPFTIEVWVALMASIIMSLLMMVIYWILHPVKEVALSDLLFSLLAAFVDQTQNIILETKSNVGRSVVYDTLLLL